MSQARNHISAFLSVSVGNAQNAFGRRCEERSRGSDLALTGVPILGHAGTSHSFKIRAFISLDDLRHERGGLVFLFWPGRTASPSSTITLYS